MKVNAGIVKVSTTALRDLFNFPEPISAINYDPFTNCMLFRLEGDSLPEVEEGNSIPILEGTVSVVKEHVFKCPDDGYEFSMVFNSNDGEGKCVYCPNCGWKLMFPNKHFIGSINRLKFSWEGKDYIL